jgi:hypothetical protein
VLTDGLSLINTSSLLIYAAYSIRLLDSTGYGPCALDLLNEDYGRHYGRLLVIQQPQPIDPPQV